MNRLIVLGVIAGVIALLPIYEARSQEKEQTVSEGHYCGPGPAREAKGDLSGWIGMKTWLTADEQNGASLYVGDPVMICNMGNKPLTFDRIEMTFYYSKPKSDSVTGSTIYFSSGLKNELNHHQNYRVPMDERPEPITVDPSHSITFEDLTIYCDVTRDDAEPTMLVIELFQSDQVIYSSNKIPLPLYYALPTSLTGQR